MNKPIRVMLVDDHAMVRKGLATFLKIYDDLKLVGEAGGGEEALKLSAKVQPDVILMDMVLPDMDGAQATQKIREVVPNVQVIMLSSFKDGDFIKKALEAGAIGYLLKDISADELAKAIRAAHLGHATLSPEIVHSLVKNTNMQPAPGFDLTEREIEVLGLMVEGLSNTQIAARLGVSSSTVKSHVSNVLSKLGVESRTEAVTLALRTHLIP